jgi:hypothetical protein
VTSHAPRSSSPTRSRHRAYHTHDSRRSQAGFPDLVLVRPPRLIFAELKTAKGRVSPAQGEWLEDLGHVASKVGPRIEVAVWRPDDLQRIAEVLAGAGMDPDAGRAYARSLTP